MSIFTGEGTALHKICCDRYLCDFMFRACGHFSKINQLNLAIAKLQVDLINDSQNLELVKFKPLIQKYGSYNSLSKVTFFFQ